MARLTIWLLVILLIGGGVYTAVKSRYEYSTQGATQVRTDRWTGDVQVWGCAAYEFRGTETAVAPLAVDTTSNKPCTRYGWITRK